MHADLLKLVIEALEKAQFLDDVALYLEVVLLDLFYGLAKLTDFDQEHLTNLHRIVHEVWIFFEGHLERLQIWIVMLWSVHLALVNLLSSTRRQGTSTSAGSSLLAAHRGCALRRSRGLRLGVCSASPRWAAISVGASCRPILGRRGSLTY